MKLLIDTNIFLEVILEQEKAKEVRTFLPQVEVHKFSSPTIPYTLSGSCSSAEGNTRYSDGS
jgi:predicted nucleic acid-binding protein